MVTLDIRSVKVAFWDKTGSEMMLGQWDGCSGQRASGTLCGHVVWSVMYKASSFNHTFSNILIKEVSDSRHYLP